MPLAYMQYICIEKEKYSFAVKCDMKYSKDTSFTLITYFSLKFENVNSASEYKNSRGDVCKWRGTADTGCKGLGEEIAI